MVRYAQYDVTLSFVDGSNDYYAGINCENNAVFLQYVLDGCFKQELDPLYRLLKGEEQQKT